MNLPSEPSVIPVALSSREKARLQQRHALHDIAKECGVTVGGLGSYLRRYWRELVLRRHQIHADGKKAEDIKIMEAGKQSIHAHAKYKDAVAACDSLEYIDLNVSQVARKFGTDGTALANFMRIHYPETLVWREKVRRRLGINDNIWHGARPECTEQYAKAVEMYRNTEMTMREVSAACKVSPSGFSQHLRFYHKEILKRRKQKRKTAKAKRLQVLGELTGNGRIYRPSPATEQRYAQALELYRNTTLTMKEIVRRTHDLPTVSEMKIIILKSIEIYCFIQAIRYGRHEYESFAIRKVLPYPWRCRKSGIRPDGRPFGTGYIL